MFDESKIKTSSFAAQNIYIKLCCRVAGAKTEVERKQDVFLRADKSPASASCFVYYCKLFLFKGTFLPRLKNNLFKKINHRKKFPTFCFE